MMSAFTIFYVGAVVIAACVGFLAWKLLSPGEPAVPDTSEQWGLGPDDVRWEDEALEERHRGLAAVRASATKWSESIGALLGVFAVVAFVKGPDTFTDVHGWEAEAAALLVVLAAALAAAAVLLAAIAAQGAAQDVSILDGWALRTLTAERIKAAAKQLAWSRVLAVTATMCVLLAVGLTWLAALDERDEKQSTGQSALLVSGAAKEVVCGTLTMTAAGLRVVPKRGRPHDVVSPETLTLVSSCP
jgi:hypothetical protein